MRTVSCLPSPPVMFEVMLLHETLSLNYFMWIINWIMWYCHNAAKTVYIVAVSDEGNIPAHLVVTMIDDLVRSVAVLTSSLVSCFVIISSLQCSS